MAERNSQNSSTSKKNKSQDNSILTMLLSLVVIILYYMFLETSSKGRNYGQTCRQRLQSFPKQKYIMMIVLFM